MKKYLFIALMIILAGFSLPVQAATPLVDANWLAENLEKPDVVVLDVRSSPKAFYLTHIPGAIATHYGRDGWRVNKGTVPALLPDMTDLEKLVGGLGIGNDDHVVLVSHGFGPGDMAIATRIYWTFKVMGHDKVSILDGGFIGWANAGNMPVESGPPKPREAKAYKANFQRHLLATEADVKAALQDGTILIDNRTPEQYQGLGQKGSPAGPGTISGAKSVPSQYMTGGTGGIFLDKEKLKKQHEQNDAAITGKTITFCNTGHWASLGWFVSHEILGNKEARLYDGSVAEWSQNPNNPMTRAQKLK